MVASMGQPLVRGVIDHIPRMAVGSYWRSHPSKPLPQAPGSRDGGASGRHVRGAVIGGES